MRVADALSGLTDRVSLTASVSPLWLLLAVAAFTLACLGAFAASSMLVYSPTKLLNRLDGDQTRVDDLAAREGELQVTARLFLVGGLCGTVLALQYGFDPDSLPWTLTAFGALALFLCGVLPAAVAERAAEATVLRLEPLLRWPGVLLRWPVVRPIQLATRGALRLLRIREEPTSNPAEVAEEVMAAVADSVTEDELPAEEKTWIGNIVNLKDVQVSAIMTPRTDIAAIPASASLREAMAIAARHGFSRYPVFADKIDEIVGVFHVKDALRLPAGPALEASVRTLVHPPLFVPETMRGAQLLRRFQAGKLHLAIVLDEYGGTAGLVSVEDVLEEIVGDIADEHDAAEPAAAPEESIQVVEQGRIVEIPARTPVEEVNALLGTELPEDGDWETIAGLVIAHLNKIPAVGETFAIDGAEFKVLRADDRRLSRLRVTAVHAPAPEPRG
ncbi:MAG: HlyC/CorC family transporter [Planctomycetes bacterium]|nr:HlyC/CorC family transporter [Planctomycetota bacterium]